MSAVFDLGGGSGNNLVCLQPWRHGAFGLDKLFGRLDMSGFSSIYMCFIPPCVWPVYFLPPNYPLKPAPPLPGIHVVDTGRELSSLKMVPCIPLLLPLLPLPSSRPSVYPADLKASPSSWCKASLQSGELCMFTRRPIGLAFHPAARGGIVFKALSRHHIENGSQVGRC